MFLFSKAVKTKYARETYSQCGEDIIVKHIMDALSIRNFTYLDIGAYHPYTLSNTALFYEMGMKGINVEPDPYLFKEFTKYRTRDINVNMGITSSKDTLDFYIMSSPTLNTFSMEEAKRYTTEGDYKIVDTIKVNTDSIYGLLKTHNNELCPEFLSIDAEGVDEIIVTDLFNSESLRPVVVCIETLTFSDTGNGIKNIDIIKKFEHNGYLNYADTNINTIFVRQDYWNR
jgi:FkbM family methyltransferase